MYKVYRVTRKQWEQLNQPKEMWAEDMNLQSKTTMKEEAIKIGKDVHFQTKEYNKKRQTILQPSDRQKWKDWTRPGAGEWGNCTLSCSWKQQLAGTLPIRSAVSPCIWNRHVPRHSNLTCICCPGESHTYASKCFDFAGPPITVK